VVRKILMTVPGRSDETLVLEYARTRTTEALEELLSRHWARAFALARRLLGDPGAAEDATQEAFVALVRGAGRFEAGRPFAPWFQALVVNAARMAARGRARRRVHERRAASERPAMVSAEGEGTVLARELAEHVARLPFDERAPIVLHYYEGRSFDEVALAMGLPRGTASTRARRGLERLRDSLAGAGVALPAGELEKLLRTGVPPSEAPARPSSSRLETLASKKAIVALALRVVTGLVAILGVAVLAVSLAGRSEEKSGRIESPPSSGSTGTSGGRAGAEPGARPADGVAPSSSRAPTSGGASSPLGDAASSGARPSSGTNPAASEGRFLVLVKDAQGEPAPSVAVAARLVDPSSRERRRDFEGRFEGRGALEGTTDASGTFSVSSADLHAPSGRLVVFTARRGIDEGSSAPVPVESGSDRKIEVRLASPRTPAEGRGALVLHVTSGHAPFANANLEVYVHNDEPDFAGVFDRATDAEGRIALADLAPGLYSLRLNAGDRLERVALQASVEPGKATDLDVELRACAVVSGRVVCLRGSLPPETSVFLRHALSGRAVARDGTYRITNVPLGETAITAFAPGYAVVSAPLTIETAGDVTVPDLVLGQGVVVKGRVTRGGAPVSGAFVSANGDDFDRSGLWGACLTQSDGSFAISGVSPGPTSLNVAPASLAPKDGTTWRFVATNAAFVVRGWARRETSREIEVPASGELDVGEIALAAFGSVSGTVLDPNGAPVPGATVWIGGATIVKTDDHGQYKCDAVKPGRQRISAEERTRRLLLPSGTTADVDPTAPVTLDLNLVAGATISGHILSKGVSLARVGLLVERARDDGSFEPLVGGTASPELAYQLGPFLPGRYRVSTRPPSTSSPIVTLESGQSLTLDLELAPADLGRISVHVSGLEPGEQDVSAEAYHGSSLAADVLANGAIESSSTLFDPIPAGPISVAVIRGSALASGEVSLLREGLTVAKDETLELSVTVPRAADCGRLAGSVATSAPKGVGVLAIGEGVLGKAWTHEGKFAFGALPAGTYQVVAVTDWRAAPKLERAKTVTVVAGVTAAPVALDGP
jgi:RNA polymerase sigma-70 factor (ECF subfamily)